MKYLYRLCTRPASVSYTHLDVYKRQVEGSTIRIRPYLKHDVFRHHYCYDFIWNYTAFNYTTELHFNVVWEGKGYAQQTQQYTTQILIDSWQYDKNLIHPVSHALLKLNCNYLICCATSATAMICYTFKCNGHILWITEQVRTIN